MVSMKPLFEMEGWRFSFSAKLSSKPHADSSHFSDKATKQEVFAQLLEETKALIGGQRNWV